MLRVRGRLLLRLSVAFVAVLISSLMPSSARAASPVCPTPFNNDVRFFDGSATDPVKLQSDTFWEGVSSNILVRFAIQCGVFTGTTNQFNFNATWVMETGFTAYASDYAQVGYNQTFNGQISDFAQTSDMRSTTDTNPLVRTAMGGTRGIGENVNYTVTNGVAAFDMTANGTVLMVSSFDPWNVVTGNPPGWWDSSAAGYNSGLGAWESQYVTESPFLDNDVPGTITSPTLFSFMQEQQCCTDTFDPAWDVRRSGSHSDNVNWGIIPPEVCPTFTSTPNICQEVFTIGSGP